MRALTQTEVADPVAHPVEDDGRASRERVRVRILDADEMAREVALRVKEVIESRRAEGGRAVLGLPTGSSPIGVYHELIRMHREEGLDLSDVVTFNLDEYYPIEPDSLQSYHRFMRENFFDHVNVPEGSIHIPRGDIPRSRVEDHCREYERKIADAGGIALVLLGIGRSGHIGFNEPGSKASDRTRLIVLDEITRKDAASDFFEERFVPREAITMGVGTILESRRIILMATGEHKAAIIRRAVEEPQTESVSATFLQRHPGVTFYLDPAAAGQLTRVKTPWLLGPVEWDAQSTRRAVVWLAAKENKAIRKLDESDFHRNHLHDLAHVRGGTDAICLEVSEDLRRRVLYQDGVPRREQIIVFSPHPDDDVISMGGMLDALVHNENDVTLAYMTNGSVAVFDQDVRRHLRFMEMSLEVLSGKSDRTAFQRRVQPLYDFLDHKRPAQVDLEEVQRIKACIRASEAVSAVEVLGLSDANVRFLDLPFYRTGRVKKDPIGDDDVELVLRLLRELKPKHIFVAGDLSDPHGTHRMCYTAIKFGLAAYRRETGDSEDPVVWLYRGAWQEWEVDRADVFLPISKAGLDRKIEAIFKHESQKDRALFPGAYDDREFWQRARDRNRETADRLNALGLPEFYAAEAFVVATEMP
ncbi:MAG TPA: glucosamine-6-phosphate deaminase [Rhodothermales bacterium]